MEIKRSLQIAGIAAILTASSCYGMKKGIESYYERYDAPMVLQSITKHEEERLERLPSGMLRHTYDADIKIHKEEYMNGLPGAPGVHPSYNSNPTLSVSETVETP